MGPPRTTRRNVLRRLREQSGFAVPTVLVATIAAFGLATAAVVASVNSQHGVVRDQDSKQALAAAEAGVSEALLNFNRIGHTSPTCVVGTLTDGWCEVGARSLPGVSGASYSYAVRLGSPSEREIEIVSTGSSDGVTRRVDVTARSAPLHPFADANVIGLDYITIESQATVTADVATNGDVTIDPSAELNCDYAQVGEGHSIYGGGATCVPTEGVVGLPPINQGDVATNPDSNNNEVFSTTTYYTGKAPSWDSTNRHLDLSSNTTITLPGGHYSLCRLTTSANNNIFIAAGATVRIYFDAPENCPGLAGQNPAVQLDMHSNSRFTTTGGSPSSFALLFVGSDSWDTKINLSSNTQVPTGACEQDFVVYAPRTDINMASNSTFCGGIAGQSILLNANADIFTNELAGDFEPPNDVPWHYTAEEFVECSSTATSSSPDSGC
jgi:type II secretory pathway pseudopilin PulG